MNARTVVALHSMFLLACVSGSGDSTTSAEDDSGETLDSGDGDGDTGDGDGDTGDGDGDGDACETPLPPEAFEPDNQLAFGLFFGGLELEVGSSRQFQVGLIQCCVYWEALETCSAYSIDPADVGASIDPDTGLLSLADNVPDGTLVTVTADVEDGLAIVEDTVFVYDPALHPLKGSWHEVGRIPCDNSPEFVPDDPINELYFTAAGEIGVTWMPFEVYIDYVGDYVADLDTGALSISNVSGNYVPGDIDGEGLFSFEGDELVLQDMWLGSSQGSMDPPACGHRFAP